MDCSYFLLSTIVAFDSLAILPRYIVADIASLTTTAMAAS